eukprot:354533-Chlamydomonas_euryale.AAC.7
MQLAAAMSSRSLAQTSSVLATCGCFCCEPDARENASKPRSNGDVLATGCEIVLCRRRHDGRVVLTIAAPPLAT